jgi:hypothetical protein
MIILIVYYIGRMLCFSKNSAQISPAIQEMHDYDNLLNEVIIHRKLQESLKTLYLFYINRQKYTMGLIKNDEKYPFSYFQYEKYAAVKQEFDSIVKKLEKKGDDLYTNMYKKEMEEFQSTYETFLRELYKQNRLVIENIDLKKKEVQKLFSIDSPKVSFLKKFVYVYTTST